jgi:glycerate kinase
VAWLGAELVPGIDAVLEAARFDELCARADWVFTAEGALDAQTLRGKTIAGVARAAKAHGVPVVAFGGAVKLSGAELDELGVASAFALPDAPMSLADCIARADELLANAAERAARLLK